MIALCPTVGHAAGRIVVLVQGLGSELGPGIPGVNAPVPDRFVTLHYQLVDVGYKSGTSIVYFSYDGGGLDGAGRWVPNQYQCARTGRPIQESVGVLRSMVLSLHNSYPGAKITIVGHSLGGFVAARIMHEIGSGELKIPTGVIEQVITVDSPLLGPNKPLSDPLYDVLGVVMNMLTSSNDCKQQFLSSSAANELRARSVDPNAASENLAIAQKALLHNVKLVNFANESDCLYNTEPCDHTWGIIGDNQYWRQLISYYPADSVREDLGSEDDTGIGHGSFLTLYGFWRSARIVVRIGEPGHLRFVQGRSIEHLRLRLAGELINSRSPRLPQYGASRANDARASGMPMLSGTSLRTQSTTSSWFLYPGACADRASGTWSPRTSLVADSLDTYSLGGTGGYGRIDHSGTGELWGIAAGSYYSTSDLCALQKNDPGDHFFFGADPVTKRVIPGQFNSIVSCTFAIPAGTATVDAFYSEYLNLPRGSGYVQYADYRVFRNGMWSEWKRVSAGGSVEVGGLGGWTLAGGELPEASQADSVQVRYGLRCVPGLASDGQNCAGDVDYGVLYDDLLLRVTTGVPVPSFSIFDGALPQTTFVDGTMTGLNCAATPCWPGVRGTALQTNADPVLAASAIRDNVNSPMGDSVSVRLLSGLRPNGMGINWQSGFDVLDSRGLSGMRVNGAFNPAHDKPRMIYRLFDPATAYWGPWDSTALDADAVAIADGDTAVVESEFRLDWPPRDRAGLNLPGGFSINGVSAYNSLEFLPRGTRMQYYFKAVDINGGTTYAFSTAASSNEVMELPLLPGGNAIAPDIMEYAVLPGIYPAGAPGSLLQGRTTTPVLNLDGAYTLWSFGQDPIQQALRGMGVRSDRYRYFQALDQGHNFGGHELAGAPSSYTTHFFPNMEEFGILDSLASWYRIVIQSSHLREWPVFEEQDAALLSEWAKRDTGVNGGDRCLFLSGDDAFNGLTNQPPGLPFQQQRALASDVFGVAGVMSYSGSGVRGAWSGANYVPYPTVDDRFAAQASGPGLAAPGSFTYEVDGGCPTANRFDPLNPQGVAQTTALSSAYYPAAAGVTDVAGVATTGEWDSFTDLDRTKSLGYGYSIQYVRGSSGAFPRNAANYVHSGVANRMQVLYKFLTGCRGARGGGSSCWPCPAPPISQSNWALATGFQTETYGPLYPIQDHTTATGVEEEQAVLLVPHVNELGQNRPNPFNPRTVIRYSLARSGRVSIRIFDIAGRLVRTLVEGQRAAGWHEAVWNGKTSHGSDAASGVYFYRIGYPDGGSSARKMTILR